MIKKILACFSFICFAISGHAESPTSYSNKQELNIQLEYRQLADHFHLIDNLTESTPVFFLIPDYKNLWIERFGDLSDKDLLIFKQYRDLRMKYQNTSFFDEMIPSEKSGLFAPNPNDVPDIIADAFYTSITIEEALDQLAGKIEVQETEFIKYFFEFYEEKLLSFAQFDNNKLKIELDYFNSELNSENTIATFAEIIDFYKSGPQRFKSTLIFWSPSRSFRGACYGDHLQVKLPINDLPVDDDYVMKFLTSVILHEATHHISGSAPSDQKQQLSRTFLNKVKSIDESHFLDAIEEPLVMAHQMRFVKNAYPKIYSENADWFNHPLAKRYLCILEDYISNKKPIDTTFILKLADIYVGAGCKATEYNIPPSIRFTCSRENSEPEIIYYFKPPDLSLGSYPILILCGGSSSKGSIGSEFFMFEYFKEKVAALNAGFITVEQWGIDGKNIDEETFFNHYSRTQRFNDHMQVIKHLESNPPDGWSGDLIFLGVSEGGPLVTSLTTSYPRTLATVNWSGEGDWPWVDEVWVFLEDMKKKSNVDALDGIPSTREEYDALIEQIKTNPSTTDWFAGMTYFYLADAFRQAPTKYDQIRSPFLVVEGTDDPNIDSRDEFVRKAKEAGAPIEYIRVERMDHYIRKRPDIIDQSFDWLKNCLSLSSILPRQPDLMNAYQIHTTHLSKAIVKNTKTV